MNKKQKRKHERIDSLNLLNYVCIDKVTGENIQGMGRTLNVSQGGILLETHIAISMNYAMSIAIGLEDEMIDIKGKVIYCREGDRDKFESGIEFQEINEVSLRILNKYIIAFRTQQNDEEYDDDETII